MIKRIICKIVGHKTPKRRLGFPHNKKCARCETTIWSRI